MSKDSEKRVLEADPTSIRLVETPSGEEVALGMRAQLREGMSAAAAGQKGMSGPQESMPAKQPDAPPPKPPDARQSATPKKP